MELPYVKIYRDFIETITAMTDAEAGRLMKAVILYANGEEVNLTGSEKFVFLMMKAQIDRDRKQYESVTERNRINGAKGGRPAKTQNNPVGYFGNPDNPAEPRLTQKSQEEEKEKEKEENKEERESTRARTQETKRFFGEFKHVALTDAQRAGLDNKLGAADAAKYIQAVDEYVQRTGKHYNDYSLTVEKAARERWGEPATRAADPKDHPMITRKVSEAEFGTDFYSAIMNRHRG